MGIPKAHPGQPSQFPGSGKRPMHTVSVSHTGDVVSATGLPNSFGIVKWFQNGSSREMNVNGAVTPVLFNASPPANRVWYINKLVYTISDSAFGVGTFGAIAALTNGCELMHMRVAADVHDLLGGFPLKTNLDVFSLIPVVITNIGILSGGINVYSVELPIRDLLGRPYIVDGSQTERLQFRVRDNLTGLDAHRLCAYLFAEESV